MLKIASEIYKKMQILFDRKLLWCYTFVSEKHKQSEEGGEGYGSFFKEQGYKKDID